MLLKRLQKWGEVYKPREYFSIATLQMLQKYPYVLN